MEAQSRSLQKIIFFITMLVCGLKTVTCNHCHMPSRGGSIRPPRRNPTYPLVCYHNSTNPIREITTEIFNPIDVDLEQYQCRCILDLIFMIEVPGVLQYKIYIGNDSDWIYADHFNIGRYSATVTICRNLYNQCFQSILDLGNVTLVVNPHSKRLFPNTIYYYHDIRPAENEDDAALTIRFSNSFPFFDNYYNQLYIVSNGLLTLGPHFDHWWPNPIPCRISPICIIAPYWTDLDFRNNAQNSGMYYHIYNIRESSDSYRSRTEKIMDEFQRRLTNYSFSDTDFEPQWLLVVTWNNASPYPAASFHHERMTFQLVLSTDYISTYAYFLYNDSDWDSNLAFSRPVTIGYDASDYDNYEQISLPLRGDYFNMDTLRGNTGLNGEWYFNFTSVEATNPNGLCRKWSQDHIKFRLYLPITLSCPCTYEQALLDWRFWFGYFWGISSMPHCATLVFSPPNTAYTIECCYDNSGSLIVDSRYSGSYFRYNPLYFYQQHVLDDRQPHEHCCIEANLCQLYHLYRPPSQCSQYKPPKSCFLYGGGHIKSIDGKSFTFNGVGEYWLLKSLPYQLSIQVRFIQFQTTNLTVVSAVAIKHQSIRIQVEARTRRLNLYVNGEVQRLANDNTVYVVTNSGMHTLSGLAIENLDLSSIANSMNQLLIRANGSDMLFITLPSGASLRITLQVSFLQITIELTSQFRNNIKGLVGTFNDTAHDDFTLPNSGARLASDAHEFGLAWHVDTTTESIFTYFGSDNHSVFNNNYEYYQPIAEITCQDLPSVILDICDQDKSCCHDYAITRDIRVASSTKNSSISCRLLNSTLDNHPPVITPASPQSNYIIRFSTSQHSIVGFNVSDPDRDCIPIFLLKGPVENIGIQLRYIHKNVYGEISGSYVGYELPSGNISLYAEDSYGASSTRRISIILCGCANSGTCVQVNTREVLELNEHGHLKEVCLCPEHYGGDSCEINLRGCTDNACPDYSECVENSSLPSGYYCSGCAIGYIFQDYKCTDINECSTENLIDRHQCSQLCINTEGSYTCQCHNGYRLSADGRSCEDIDECSETSSSCSQVCINTEGSFICECHTGFELGNDNWTCTMVTCQTNEPCASSLECTVANGNQYQCVCPVGRRCTGTCFGQLSSANQYSRDQQCVDCIGPKYGYNCSLTCNCGLRGTCDKSNGCMCDNGWGGINCDIEYNNFPPVFDIDTPSVVRVKYTRRPRRTVTGTVVIDINATDADAPNQAASTISYSLSNAPLPGVSNCTTFLSIDPNTGVILASPDLEILAGNISECILAIKAEDNAVERRSTTTTIAVILLPVPIITVSPTESIQIEENLAEGSAVANVMCTEIGPSSGSLVISLRGAFIHYFYLDINQSSLSIARMFDFETLQDRSRPFYEIEIVCRNRHGLTDVMEVSVEILNLDDNPFVFESDQYAASVSENSTINQTVISMTAYDNDVPDGTIEYFLVNSSEYFSINSTTGVVTIASLLDHEYQDQFMVEVEARLEETGHMTRVNLTVDVLDVNDVAPMFVFQSYSVQNLDTRNAIGDHVITILAVDRDLGSNGNITYQIEANDFFIINETTGSVTVKSALLPNLNLTLTVYAMDNGSPQLSSNTNVDVLVHPSLEHVRFTRSQYQFTIPEDEPIGSFIGQIEATVVDDSNTAHEELQVMYEITSVLFTIRNKTGEIYLVSGLDYDLVARQHLLNITASYHVAKYDITLMTEVTVIFYVLNVNDNPPQFTPTIYATTVYESTPAGSSIIAVQATDIDGIGAITYSLEDESNSFAIDSQTGDISVRVNLSTAQDYRFYAVASDGQLSSQAVVHVSVSRRVSVIPTFTKEQYIFNVSEKFHMMQTEVGRVQALLYGARFSYEHPSVKFRISGPNCNASDQFDIDQTVGTISTKNTIRLDAESQNTYILYVEVFNSTDGAVFDKTTVKIKIDDSNDNAPIFNQSLYTRVVTVEDSITFGSQILTVSASDHDTSTNAEVMYSLSLITPGFAINSTSGEITAENTTLTPGAYNLSIFASDRGFPPQTGRVSAIITVTPTTSAGIEFTQSVYTFEVSENAVVGYIIGMVLTTSNESNVSFSTQTVYHCIYVNQTSGQIQVSCTLDRESQAVHEIAVVALVGDLVGRCRVIITVLDINEYPPVFVLDAYAEVINIKHGNDTPIIQVQTNDIDGGNSDRTSYAIFSIAGGNTSNCSACFTIDESDGSIYSQESPLPAGNYLLLVQASDQGGLNSTGPVFIYVTEVHPPYVFLESAFFTVGENLLPGFVVGYATLIASGHIVNPENHNNLSFSIISNMTSNTFEGDHPFGINSQSGAIYTQVSLDYERMRNYTVTICANFTYGVSVEALYDIYITDANDIAPQFQPSAYFGSANDSTQKGTAVATVIAFDLDSEYNSQLRFEIDPSVPFGVSVTSISYPYTIGEIYVRNSSEFILSFYNFSVLAIDSGTVPLTGIAQVIINIAYELPDSISFMQDVYQFQVTENSPQTAGIVSIAHRTPALVGLVHSIVNESDYFAINETNGIISTKGIDREGHPLVNLTISAFLPSKPSLEPAYTTVIISVEDINDNPPIFSQLNYSIVYLTTEISLLDELIQLEVTDLDYGQNAEIFFVIESVLPELYTNDFYITENGSIYTNNIELNATVYSLNVSAQDMGTPNLISTTTVSIRIQLPVPSVINFTEQHYIFHVRENTDIGTQVGYVLLEDIANHVEPYISFSVDNANFSITAPEGEIRTIDVFDYESQQNYNFIVKAWMIISDRVPPANISTSASVTVSVINIDDNPPLFLDLPQNLSWFENRTSEEVIYRIAAVDMDTGGLPQQIEFEILNTEILDTFRIHNETGDLYIAESLDREIQEHYTITIQVSDSATPSNSMQSIINFTLLDINDNCPMILIYADNNTMVDSAPLFINFSDEAETGKVITNISVIDFDAGRNGDIFITIDSGGPFDTEVMSHDHPYTYGHLFVVNTSLLIPGEYLVNITAMDMGEVPLQSTALVTVIVEYALPEFISFANNIHWFRVIESSRGTEIGRVSVEQSTPALEGLVYRILEPGWERLFSLNVTSGVITNIAEINRESIPQINFTISAFLPSEPSLQSARTTVIVDIEDINDNRPIFTQTLYSVDILTTEISTMQRLLQVTANDADSGLNALISFHIEAVYPQEYSNDFYVTQNGSIFTNNTNLSATTYHLRISARDMGEISLESAANVTISVIAPIPDALHFTQPEGYTFSLRENTTPSVIVGRVHLDQLSSYFDLYLSFFASHMYFSVNTTTGHIQTLNTFDYEEKQDYTFQVVATLIMNSSTPPVNLATTVNVTVLIIDINDNAPIFTNFPFNLSWPENRTSEELIHQIVATDADSGRNQLLVYEVLDHVLLNKFRIDNRTGELYVFPSLDREERDNYTVTIQVRDSGSPQHIALQTINFRLEDINDNIPRLTSGFDIQVHERASPRLIFNFIAVDPDVGTNGTVDIYKVNVTKHSITQGVLMFQNEEIITITLTGEVWLNEELDYEDANHYDIAISLRDRGYPPLETFYTNITLDVIDVPDSRPQFMFAADDMIYYNNSDPLLHVGDVIAQVLATDEDFNNSISYNISSVIWQGNSRNPVPGVSIDTRTGIIYSNTEQQIAPESSFIISVMARDNSQYNLFAEVTVQITIVPLPLAFVESYYTTESSEAIPPGTNVIAVQVEHLSVSSDVEYSLNTTYPSNQGSIFTIHHTNVGEILLSTVRQLDRETAENYTIIVTGTRGSEYAQTTVFITITDVNDNAPLFMDQPNAVIYVSELLSPRTTIARVNVTDADAGSNGRVQFQLDYITPDAPFDINAETGDIILTDQVDYESVSTFSLRVIVTDGGMPPQQNSNIYIINVINENDIPPRFSAPAYFGEIYAHVPINDYVRHTVVHVHNDYSNDEHQLLFSISSLTGTNHGYAFTIMGDPPYYIRVIQSPIEPNITFSQLLELQITVTTENGHGLSSTVPLYISVFTADNLLMFDLTGATIEELMSCEEGQSSICGFREALRDATAQILRNQANFYNNSVQRSERDISVFRVTMYGWYGSYYLGRDSNGELLTSRRPPSVEYINASIIKNITIKDILTFNATLVVSEAPSVTTVVDCKDNNIIVTVLEIVLGILSSITMVLIIGFVYVYIKKKQESSRASSSGSLHLQKSTECMPDEAYVMYHGDEIMNTVQTTPFSDNW